MTSLHLEFPRTFGQEAAKEAIRRAVAFGRVPHALLVHGEPGLGQHALLLDTAQILSCEDAETRPCGRCFPCRAFDASALETLQYLIPVEHGDSAVAASSRADADDDADDGDWEEEEGPGSAQIAELAEAIARWHEQPYAFHASRKAIVRMSQVRGLLGRLRYAGTDGRPRIILVPWLEKLQKEQSNALLKTLEEPPPGVHFLIASEHRAGALQTVLSRCLHVPLTPLPDDVLRATAGTLSARAGVALAPRLLPLAEGSPGAYLELLEDAEDAGLDAALSFMTAALSDWREFADHLAGISSGAEGMEQALALLRLLLRLLRAHQVLRARHPGPRGGKADGYAWTRAALDRAGWDEGLLPYLGVFEEIADPEAFARFLTEGLRAVRGYSKPSIALLGLFLEHEARITGVAA